MFRYVCLLVVAVAINIGLAQTTFARGMGYNIGWYMSRESPEVNIYLSARYDHLLQISPRFRAYRMRKECHPISIPPLYLDCIGSFDQYEPLLVSYRGR